MRRSQPRTVVAVEVLAEEDVVLPLGIVLKPVDPAEARSATVLADEEERHEATAEILGDLCKRVLLAGAGRVLDGQVVPEEPGVPAQRADDEIVDGERDRPAPVGVAAEHPGCRLGGLVVDLCADAADVELEWVLSVPARDRTQAVGGEEVRFVEQALEQPQHVRDGNGSEQKLALARFAATTPSAVPSSRSSMRAARLSTPRALPTICSSTTTAANSGSIPTIDRTLSGTCDPSGSRRRS